MPYEWQVLSIQLQEGGADKCYEFKGSYEQCEGWIYDNVVGKKQSWARHPFYNTTYYIVAEKFMGVFSD